MNSIEKRFKKRGKNVKRVNIFKLKKGKKFIPDKSYRFMRLKLFKDVKFKLIGTSFKLLGENKFFYSAYTNGGKGRESV